MERRRTHEVYHAENSLRMLVLNFFGIRAATDSYVAWYKSSYLYSFSAGPIAQFEIWIYFWSQLKQVWADGQAASL